MPEPTSYEPLQIVIECLALERGQRRLFEGLDLTIASGQMVAVTGPNGAGKSTLLRALAGLLRPAAGTLRLVGAAEPDAAVAAHAHYVGHADASRGALSARETLSFWAAMLGAATDAARPGVAPAEALAAVDLPHVADLPFAYLSAGQKRRAALARLLVAPRPIWLLDEPLTALDAAAQALVTRLMRSQIEAGGLVVAATHGALGVAGVRELRLGSAA